MSKIGRKSLALPQGVTVELDSTSIIVVGPKGRLTADRLAGIDVKITEGKVQVVRLNEERQTRAFHGLVRSLINNMIIGVTTGYKKTLKLLGTGYRVTAKGKGISLAVGFSHPVDVVPPSESITLKVDGNDTIYIEGIDKQAVGQVAANIRGIKPPEVYKGKGIRYENEVVKLKPGKTAGK